jgi:DNA-binding MarR family transcriptional regulator
MVGDAMRASARPKGRTEAPTGYVLDQQFGFILRQVAQRHAAIFAGAIGEEVTTTQWAALAKLHEAGPLSQNLLGRLTVMDAATIKGVIDRLSQRGLTQTHPDPVDRRRRLVSLTPEGAGLVERTAASAARITEETLAPLDAREREALMALLLKLR